MPIQISTRHVTLTPEPLGDGVLIEAHAHGTLDGDDYDVLIPELNAQLESGKTLSFLLILDDFHGWDLESMWRELKWDEKHRKSLDRIAVVGDRAWEKWATKLSTWFLPGNVRYFDRPEEPAAREWIAGKS